MKAEPYSSLEKVLKVMKLFITPATQTPLQMLPKLPKPHTVVDIASEAIASAAAASKSCDEGHEKTGKSTRERES